MLISHTMDTLHGTFCAAVLRAWVRKSVRLYADWETITRGRWRGALHLPNQSPSTLAVFPRHALSLLPLRSRSWPSLVWSVATNASALAALQAYDRDMRIQRINPIKSQTKSLPHWREHALGNRIQRQCKKKLGGNARHENRAALAGSAVLLQPCACSFNRSMQPTNQPIPPTRKTYTRVPFFECSRCQVGHYPLKL